MGGVIDGQSVNAAITDPAFLFKNADDTATVIYTLANPNAESGATVDNVQGSVNALGTWTGMPSNNPVTGVPPWDANYVGASGDDLFTRAEALTHRFSGSAGHTHDGTDGNGPQIVASGLAGILGIDHGGTAADTASGAFSNLAPTPSASGDVIQWDGTEWTSDPLDAVNLTGILPITHGGTGAAIASGGFANLAPAPGPSGYVMTSDGTEWISAPASGGGGGGGIVQFEFEVFVDATLGNDGTGDGSLSKPFKTISAAIASISVSDFDHQYIIRATSGEYSESPTLPPYVSLQGDGMSTTAIFGTVTQTVGVIGDKHMSFLKDFFATNVTLNTSAATLLSSIVVESVNFQTTFSITGGPSGQNYFLKDVCGSFYFGGAGTGTITCTGSMNLYMQDCRVSTTQLLSGTGAPAAILRDCKTAIVNSGASLDIDAATLLEAPSAISGTGGSITTSAERAASLSASSVTLGVTKNLNLLDATSAAITANLPPIARARQERMTLIKVDSSVNAVTLTPDGSETINGLSSYVLASQYDGVTLVGVSGSTDWKVVSEIDHPRVTLPTSSTTYSGESYAICDATGGPIVYTLLSASGLAGKQITIENIFTGGSPVTVTAAGGDTIEGAASVDLSPQNPTITIVSDGTPTWRIICGRQAPQQWATTVGLGSAGSGIVSLVAGSTDKAGRIIYACDALGSSGDQVTVQTRVFDQGTFVTLTPTNAKAATDAVAVGIYIDGASVSTNGFTIYFDGYPSVATTYMWDYLITETPA